MDNPVYTIARRKMILGRTHVVNSINNNINKVYVQRIFRLSPYYGWDAKNLNIEVCQDIYIYIL